MNINEILQHDEAFRYQLLDRLRMDCEYYLGMGGRNASSLWAKDEAEQIDTMKAIWKSFTKGRKPEWLKYGQIVDYEKAMLNKV